MVTNLHPDTRMGPIALTVTDLKRSTAFYTTRLGFQIHAEAEQQVSLGAGNEDLLILTENRSARAYRGTAGLYHFAVLVPSRYDLARSLKTIAETQTPVQGFADHGVSEAIYLPDPDSTGIEVYRDRPRDEWPWEGNQLAMVTDPLNIDSLLGEIESNGKADTGLHRSTVIGHIHLHVSHIAESISFYRDVIGFELMQRYGSSAAFLSAGGYHHHLGINTWAGTGAPPQPDDGVGLRWYTIYVPNTAERDAVSTRAEEAGISMENREEGLLLHDPSQNGIMLAVEPTISA